MFAARTLCRSRPTAAKFSLSSQSHGKDKLVKLRQNIHVNDMTIKARQIVKWLDKDLGVTVQLLPNRKAPDNYEKLESLLMSCLKECSAECDFDIDMKSSAKQGPFILSKIEKKTS